MASYFYLISSLPMLKADGEMPFKYNEFLKMCKTAVSEQKYNELAELTLSSSKGPLVSEWHKFYGVLETEMAFQRNQRLNRPVATPYNRNEGIARTVTAAINQKNPLLAEQMLLSLEFDKLDELIGTHYFDDYALMGYAIKLKLLERKSVFVKETGKAELDRLVNLLEQEVLNI